MQSNGADSESRFTLTGGLDISAVEGLLSALMEYSGSHPAICLDLSQIQTCDAAGLQLLLALKKSAEAAGKPMALVAAPDMFTRVASQLGISDGNLTTKAESHASILMAAVEAGRE